MLDLNISYQEIGVGSRLGASVYMLSQIPERLIMSIISVAKTVLFATLTALTFGKFPLFSYETQVSYYKTCNNLGSLFLCITSILFPLNSSRLINNLNSWCFDRIYQKTTENWDSYKELEFIQFYMKKNIL